MGGNIVRRLMLAGHSCVVYDKSADAVSGLAREGAAPSRDLADFVAQLEKPRAVWVMLLGGLSTLVLGVWARLAPGFVASKPASARPLIAGAICWFAGVFALALGLTLGPWLLLAGFGVITGAIGVFGAGIARQPLHGHARLTRIGVRSAFLWAFVGLAIIAAQTRGVLDSYFQVSAARHALARVGVAVELDALHEAARAVADSGDSNPEGHGLGAP